MTLLTMLLGSAAEPAPETTAAEEPPPPTSPADANHFGRRDDEEADDDGDEEDDEEEELSEFRDDLISLSSSSVSCESIPEVKRRQNLQKLYHIVSEIYTSEAKFVATLRLLNVDFRKHIVGSQQPQQKAQQQQSVSTSNLSDSSTTSSTPSTTLSASTVEFVTNSMLKHLPHLQMLNENLLDELRLARDNWPKTQKISHVLVKIGPFLKHYSGYIREFESMQKQYLEQLKKYPKFAEKVREFEQRNENECNKLNMQHHLLKPIQRIPQYRLLLQQYLHHLKPDDVDYEDTVNALEVVSRVAEHANQAMNEDANFAKLLALQAKVVCKQKDIVQPGRVFVKEGELLKVCRKHVQPRWFVLLSDALLYMTQIQSSDILYLNYELPLDDCQLVYQRDDDAAGTQQQKEPQQTTTATTDDKDTKKKKSQQLQQTKNLERQFSVHTTIKSFTLIAKSRQERDEWLRAMRQTIDDYVERKQSFLSRKHQLVAPLPEPKAAAGELLGRKAPLWTPDAQVANCQLCTSNFSALFRRHHCRACGRVVCSACSSNKAPLIYLKCRASRVCDQCFESLKANIHLYYLPTTRISNQVDERELRRLDEHFRMLLKNQFVRHVGLDKLRKLASSAAHCSSSSSSAASLSASNKPKIKMCAFKLRK